MTDVPPTSRELEWQVTAEEREKKYTEMLKTSTEPWSMFNIPTICGPVDVILEMLEDRLNHAFGPDGYAVTLYLTNLDRPRREDDRTE